MSQPERGTNQPQNPNTFSYPRQESDAAYSNTEYPNAFVRQFNEVNNADRNLYQFNGSGEGQFRNARRAELEIRRREAEQREREQRQVEQRERERIEAVQRQIEDRLTQPGSSASANTLYEAPPQQQRGRRRGRRRRG